MPTVPRADQPVRQHLRVARQAIGAERMEIALPSPASREIRCPVSRWRRSLA
jgi:hypothetical protein